MSTPNSDLSTRRLVNETPNPSEQSSLTTSFETILHSQKYSYQVVTQFSFNELVISLKDLDPTNIPSFTYQGKFTLEDLTSKSKIFKIFDSVTEIPEILKELLEKGKYKLNKTNEVLNLKLTLMNVYKEEEIDLELYRVVMDNDSIIEELSEGISKMNKKAMEYAKLYNEMKKLHNESKIEIEKLIKENKELIEKEKKFNDIVNERDKLKGDITTLTNEKNTIHNNLTSITKERDTLKTTVTTLSNEKNTIHNNLNNIIKERDSLKTTVTTLTNEKNNINNNLTNITKERDTLKTNVADLTKERDALKTTINTLITEKKTIYYHLTNQERDKLKTILTKLTKERNTLKTDFTEVDLSELFG